MADQWEFKQNIAPADAPESVKGLWNEYVNDRGESSITTHELKTVWQSCPKGECYFELTDSARRECTCNKCGAIAYFVVGLQKLQDGKIISVR